MIERDEIGYMDVRDRGVFVDSKVPIYYFTLDGMPSAMNVIARRMRMSETEFLKMMKLFGAKRYGAHSVFKSKDSIEEALCWIKVIMG